MGQNNPHLMNAERWVEQKSIAEALTKGNVSHALAEAIIFGETSGNHEAIGSVGEKSIFQIRENYNKDGIDLSKKENQAEAAKIFCGVMQQKRQQLAAVTLPKEISGHAEQNMFLVLNAYNGNTQQTLAVSKEAIKGETSDNGHLAISKYPAKIAAYLLYKRAEYIQAEGSESEKAKAYFDEYLRILNGAKELGVEKTFLNQVGSKLNVEKWLGKENFVTEARKSANLDLAYQKFMAHTKHVEEIALSGADALEKKVQLPFSKAQDSVQR